MTMSERDSIISAKRWVVKIGSALLTDDGRGLNAQLINQWVDRLAKLSAGGIELVIVSSGAVAAGMTRLGWSERPTAIHHLQAAAAVGQMGLVQTWETAFARYSMHTAQILLVHDDLSHRQRYLNARSAINTLIELGVVPVVNENDTVVTDEFRFGDNDTLAAMVANLIDADLLLILTDQQGLFDSDPRDNPNAKLISQAAADDEALLGYAGASKGHLGQGGMATKIKAARLASRSGTDTIIVDGKNSTILTDVASGKLVGTLLTSGSEGAARKHWLAVHSAVNGSLLLDDGAAHVLKGAGGSLLAVGVTEVKGQFDRGEIVLCVDSGGREIAKGIVNYSSIEAGKIAGKHSAQFEEILGYRDQDELIHRDNLVLI
ncbi:MAG: glutamate 5-kinase [Flavobacteriales bacterium]|jgi:glutamate 5-kinase